MALTFDCWWWDDDDEDMSSAVEEASIGGEIRVSRPRVQDKLAENMKIIEKGCSRN